MTWTDGLPTELHLTVGEVVRIPLEGAMGAGNTWSVTVDDGASAVTTRIAVAPPAPPPPPPGADPGAEPPPSSSSAREVLEISARAPGRARLHLRLGRSWEAGALARHTLVTIVA